MRSTSLGLRACVQQMDLMKSWCFLLEHHKLFSWVCLSYHHNHMMHEMTFCDWHEGIQLSPTLKLGRWSPLSEVSEGRMPKWSCLITPPKPPNPRELPSPRLHLVQGWSIIFGRPNWPHGVNVAILVQNENLFIPNIFNASCKLQIGTRNWEMVTIHMPLGLMHNAIGKECDPASLPINCEGQLVDLGNE